MSNVSIGAFLMFVGCFVCIYIVNRSSKFPKILGDDPHERHRVAVVLYVLTTELALIVFLPLLFGTPTFLTLVFLMFVGCLVYIYVLNWTSKFPGLLGTDRQEKRRVSVVIYAVTAVLGLFMFSSLLFGYFVVRALESRDVDNTLPTHAEIIARASWLAKLQVPGDARVIKFSDTHGGFLGDGDTEIEIRLTTAQSNRVSEILHSSNEWKPLPVADALYRLPMPDNAIIHAESGFYMFRDIQVELHGKNNRVFKTRLPPHERSSFNFVIVIFTPADGILYVYRIDT